MIHTKINLIDLILYLEVLLWLDDIGIPQYRESMAENMIDGQMLTMLTAQDLIEVDFIIFKLK